MGLAVCDALPNPFRKVFRARYGNITIAPQKRAEFIGRLHCKVDAMRFGAGWALLAAMCTAARIVFDHFRSAFLVELGVGSRFYEGGHKFAFLGRWWPGLARSTAGRNGKNLTRRTGNSCGGNKAARSGNE